MACRDYEVCPGTRQTGEHQPLSGGRPHFINVQADGYARIIRDANIEVERLSEIDNAASEKREVTHIVVLRRFDAITLLMNRTAVLSD